MQQPVRGHGFKYTVQVTVWGAVHAETGRVVDLGGLDGFAGRELLERFDCANLKDDAAFRAAVPSTENLCLEVWRCFEHFVAEHAGLTLRRVRIGETGKNAFEYFGDGAPQPLLG